MGTDSKICLKCKEKNNPSFSQCWKCGYLFCEKEKQENNQTMEKFSKVINELYEAWCIVYLEVQGCKIQKELVDYIQDFEFLRVKRLLSLIALSGFIKCLKNELDFEGFSISQKFRAYALKIFDTEQKDNLDKSFDTIYSQTEKLTITDKSSEEDRGSFGVFLASAACLEREKILTVVAEYLEELGTTQYLDAKSRAYDILIKCGIKLKPTVELARHLNLGKYFYLCKYENHYDVFLKGVLNKSRILCELFLFRAWVTQLGFRLANPKREFSDGVIYEVVNLCSTLGRGLVLDFKGIKIEEIFDNNFISILNERWQDYDDVFLKHQGNPEESFWAISKRVCELCAISEPEKQKWLCEDFTLQLREIMTDYLSHVRSGAN